MYFVVAAIVVAVCVAVVDDLLVVVAAVACAVSWPSLRSLFVGGCWLSIVASATRVRCFEGDRILLSVLLLLLSLLLLLLSLLFFGVRVKNCISVGVPFFVFVSLRFGDLCGFVAGVAFEKISVSVCTLGFFGFGIRTSPK